MSNEQNIATETNTGEVVKPVTRPLPPPGVPLSFEDALKLTMKKYDKTLRELAK